MSRFGNDTLGRYLQGLGHRTREVREKAAKDLRIYVEAEAREMSGSAFSKFMKEATQRIYDMVNIQDAREAHERIGGIMAIEELIDVPCEDNDTKIIRFANLLRMVFQDATFDSATLIQASRALGHLARAGGAVTADFVEFELRRSSDWLQSEPRDDAKCYAAVLVLKELATNAPVLFIPFIESFFKHIWVAIQSEGGADARRSEALRVAAIEALRAVLVIVARRSDETQRNDHQWFSRITERMREGFTFKAEASAIHGSLLVIGELLRNTGMYMNPRYEHTCKIVFAYKSHKQTFVQKTTIQLFPQLATFNPDSFVKHWLAESMNHLVTVLKGGGELYDVAFESVGDIALAVGPAIAPTAPQIIELVSSALASQSKWKKPGVEKNNEALRCVSKLARAVGPSLAPQIKSLVDQMFAVGLSRPLLDALAELARSTPSLLPAVQTRLLSEVASVLTRGTASSADANASGSAASDSVVALALTALSNFEADNAHARAIMASSVLQYLDHESRNIRREAALTVTRLLLPTPESVMKADVIGPKIAKLAKQAQGFSQRVVLCQNHHLLAVHEILRRVVVFCISEPNPNTRQVVFESLGAHFDPFLCESNCSLLLAQALHDEELVIRKAVIQIMGRLTRHNPAYVVPALRKVLMQTLTELEYSVELRHKEQAAETLTVLARHAQKFFEPYVETVARCLLKRLKESTAEGSPKLAAYLFEASAQLSHVSGPEMRNFLPELLPLLVEAIQEHGVGASGLKRDQAYRALQMVVENTGYVVEPYRRHPSLLPFLVDSLRSVVPGAGDWQQRQQAFRCIGTLGALDPAMFQKLASGSKAVEIQDAGPRGAAASAAGAAPEGDMRAQTWLRRGATATSRAEVEVAAAPGGGEPADWVERTDVFAAHAVAALLRMLNDPALAPQHAQAFQVLMKIYKGLEGGVVPYLSQIVTALTQAVPQAVRTLEPEARQSLFEHLADLVRLAGPRLAGHLPDILQVINTVWQEVLQEVGRDQEEEEIDDVSKSLITLLTVLEELARCHQDAMKQCLGELLPSMLSFLHQQRKRRAVAVQVLHALPIFGHALDGFLHLVIPALARRFEEIDEMDSGPSVRKLAVQALGELSGELQFPRLLSRVVHPLLRILDSEKSPEDLRAASQETLDALRCAFGQEFAIFDPQVRRVLARQRQVAADTSAAARHTSTATLESTLTTAPPAKSRSRRMMVADEWGEREGFRSMLSRRSHHSGIHHLLGTSRSQRDPVEGASLSIGSHISTRFSERLHDEPQPRPTSRARLPSESTVLEASLVASAFEADDEDRVEGPDQQKLRQAWEASQCSTKDDWVEWMRRLSLELLRQSPSLALRASWKLASFHTPLARELFHVSFLSCWLHLYDPYQDFFSRSLEKALSSPNLPADILQALLNLADFMDRRDHPLPIDAQTLRNLSEKCHAYAKALHYTETEFATSPASCVDSLISINTQLQQEEAALGVLVYAQKHLHVELRETWHERLQRWEDALEAYELRQLEDPGNLDWTKSRLRCLHELGEWPRLSSLAHSVWESEGAENQAETLQEVAPVAAAAEFHLQDWDRMGIFVDALEGSRNPSYEGCLYSAILAVHRENYPDALRLIGKARETLDPELTALAGESYTRAYRSLVKVQQLTELEEVITFKTAEAEKTRVGIRSMWATRLKGCQTDVDVWQAVLQIRSIVVPPTEDVGTWLKFTSLCRKSSRLDLAVKVLEKLRSNPKSARDLRVTVAFLKNRFAMGFKHDACTTMERFLTAVSKSPAATSVDKKLLARCHLKMGLWTKEIYEDEARGPLFQNEQALERVLGWFRSATQHSDEYYKAWNAWALLNFQVAEAIEAAALGMDDASSGSSSPRPGWPNAPSVAAGAASACRTHVMHAIRGFVKSAVLGSNSKKTALQDILRLLRLWFKHAGEAEAEPALREGFDKTPLMSWLQVVPQILARLRTPNDALLKSINDLLSRLAKKYPQAVVFPLTAASRSPVSSIARSTKVLLQGMRADGGDELVKQTETVSEELIRVSILWHEMWLEALEEAWRLYLESDLQGCVSVLLPLHERMQKVGPQTMREISFQTLMGKELQEGQRCILKFQKTASKTDLAMAWDSYHKVIQKVDKQVLGLSHLDMQSVSPYLLNAKKLDVVIPGTYVPEQDASMVTIASFSPSIEVLGSKQRPRVLKMMGSDGKSYKFLLKGHEDLKQDERVMQLFGLINSLLEERAESAKRDLSLTRFAVVPLSANSGLIEWVPRCDTFYQLVKLYRESRHVVLSVEYQLMRSICTQCEDLSLLQKVEVFRQGLEKTAGNDLQRVLWLQSRNSEVWLTRRTTYCRSLAVMSMVGYILGLGDRHPKNIMIAQKTGQVVHIDFGDCFEVAACRESNPERIPFRLTRMLLNALEVSGVEGNYRYTCELVMRLLRDNKDAIMAMLEAFVLDPLITWRLLPARRKAAPGASGGAQLTGVAGAVPPPPLPGAPGAQAGGAPQALQQAPQAPQASQAAASERPPGAPEGDPHLPSPRGRQEARRQLEQLGPEGARADPELLSQTARSIISRVYAKLNGTDFRREPSLGVTGGAAPAGGLDVEAQVERLLQEATSQENLCQCYVGWCPFW